MCLGKLPKQQHHAALPYDQLPDFMERLRTCEGIPSRALEFTILTAARTSEPTEAMWDEINLVDKVWTVPAERMKGGRQHRVPLTASVCVLLEALGPRKSGAIFPGRDGPISRKTLLAALKVVDKDVTTHGFRSTFSDWARERTAYPRDVVEQSLAHAIKDKSEAAYKRGDALEKRRRLMTEWARYCYSPVISGEVVALHG